MPGMNGREMADKIREQYPDIKSIYMSGYTANVIEQHGVLDNDINFVQKPFTKNGLYDIIRKTLDDNSESSIH
jgi:two-component SAPR family response regulator